MFKLEWKMIKLRWLAFRANRLHNRICEMDYRVVRLNDPFNEKQLIRELEVKHRALHKKLVKLADEILELNK